MLRKHLEPARRLLAAVLFGLVRGTVLGCCSQRPEVAKLAISLALAVMKIVDKPNHAKVSKCLQLPHHLYQRTGD